MKKIKISFVIFLIATCLLAKSNFVLGTEDEYEEDHGDNVVEHPGPTFIPLQQEIEEKVGQAVETAKDEDGILPESSKENNSNDDEEDDIIQTTTYPVFDEPLSSTTSQSTTVPATTTTTTSTEASNVENVRSTTPYTSAVNETTQNAATIDSTTTIIPFLPPHQRPARSDLSSMPLPKGQEILVGNLTIYESAVSNETFDGVMLISVHDIFGFHPHVKYISDRLSEYGFRTIVPDFFHGNPVAIENFPPPNFTETARYLFSKEGFWKPVKADLLNVMNYYRTYANITSFGMYGFCWGGKMIVHASADSDFDGINAIGLVHPSRVVTQDAKEIKAPAILLPSNAEPDMIPFLQILQQRFGGDKSEHYRYDDMRHGFAGATSDFSNPNVRRRVEDAIDKLGSYFRKHLV